MTEQKPCDCESIAGRHTENDHVRDALGIVTATCQVCADNDYPNTDGHTTEQHLASGPQAAPTSIARGEEQTGAHDLATLARALYEEVTDLYGAGILEEPDADDEDDPWSPLWNAYTAYRDALKASR